MTKFSNKSKKPYFWLIFPIFGIKNIYKKIWLCHAQQHMGLKHHADFQKKLMRLSQENFRTERRKDGRTDRQTLIYRTLLATAGGPKNCI